MCRRVKARRQIETLAGDGQRRAFTPVLILFIALPEAKDNADPGVTAFPLLLLPRRCPFCRKQTIVGHGLRRKQAHDQQHEWIWIRRGRCAPCRKTFTILPAWSPPYGHYSLRCRQQAWELLGESDSWEQAVPEVKDPNRLPDPSTVARWARRLFLLAVLLTSKLWQAAGWNISRPPTILAWDWSAISRILPVEADSS